MKSVLVLLENVKKCQRQIAESSKFRGGVTRGSRGAAAPPDFENPKKLSHKNAIKLDSSEKWGQNWPFGPP